MQRGYSLVETVVAVAIFCIFLGVGYTMLSHIFLRWSYAESQLELQGELRMAVDKMVRELRYAQKIEVLEPKRVVFLTKEHGMLERIEYYQDEKGILRRANKSGGLPLTGGNIKGKEVVMELVLQQGLGSERRMVLIRAEMSVPSGKKISYHTGVVCSNVP